MLRYNTFRSARYLRSKFVEGKYLLASEATDLQLESIDLLREYIKRDLGNCAIGSGWQVSFDFFNSTKLYLSFGEAWYEGLPFIFRSPEDALVSTTGGLVPVGDVPLGVSINNSNAGKELEFTPGVTPSGTYTVIVAAKEDLISSSQDPFLKNVNLTESTAEKIRLVYELNIVPSSSLQTYSNPYVGESGKNLVNKILGNGGVTTPYTITTEGAGSDGRNLEIKIANPVGSNFLPRNSVDQEVFAHGKLIDSLGQVYHLVKVFNDPEDINNTTILRIDTEVGQPDPVLTGDYYLVKRDVYATQDGDLTQTPQGKLFYPIAEITWDGNDFVHPTSIVDLRNPLIKRSELIEELIKRTDLVLSNPGQVSWDLATQTLSSTAGFSFTNAAYSGSFDFDFSTPRVVLEGGSVVGFIDQGTSISGNSFGVQVVNILSGGTTVTVDSPGVLQAILPGSVLVDSAGTIATVVSVDAINATIQASAALVVGSLELHGDSFAAGTVPKSLGNITLVTRLNNKLYFHGGVLELQDGETGEVGDGVTQQLLDFIGATSETDDSPAYTSTTYVNAGDSLVTAISDLDTELLAQDGRLDSLETSVSDPLYDEVLNYPTGLVALTNVTIPFNSRKVPAAQQTYTVGAGTLCVYVNGLLRKEGVDWQSVDNQTIEFLYDLTNDTQVHFRIDSVQK